jgi:hypothetical protein
MGSDSLEELANGLTRFVVYLLSRITVRQCLSVVQRKEDVQRGRVEKPAPCVSRINASTASCSLRIYKGPAPGAIVGCGQLDWSSQSLVQKYGCDVLGCVVLSCVPSNTVLTVQSPLRFVPVQKFS